MPIRKKDFEIGKFKKRYDSKLDHPVYKFLSRNPNLAYTVKEIVKNVNMNEDTVRSMLKKLKEEGNVLHKVPYFIFNLDLKKKNFNKRNKKRR